METKKSKRANLENKRVIIFQSGLVIALSLVLVAFEWNSAYDRSELAERTDFGFEEDYVVNTFRKPKPKIEPPKPIQIEEIIVVDDDDLIDDEIEINSEIDFDEPIKIIVIEDEPEEETFVPFYKVEEKPLFVGGDKALLIFLGKNTKYPPTAKEAGIQGKVYIEFIIDKNGFVTDAKIARSVHPLLDKEALRVVKSMPKWKPGLQGGKKVSVNFHVPINFVLQ
jgi:periplasmic protein TonB